MDTVQFANLTFRGLRREQLLRDEPELKIVVTVNAEIIFAANHDPVLADIINRNWATLDGQWPYLLARRRTGRKDIEKISGSDFVYELCETAAKREWRVFLLGASPEVNRQAVARLGSQYGVDIAGTSPPPIPVPFDEEINREALQQFESFRPHILVVALGSPKQELFLDRNADALRRMGVRIAIGAGGTLDFIAGTLKRAPRFVQQAGLESIWRVAQQPAVRLPRLVRALRFLEYA